MATRATELTPRLIISVTLWALPRILTLPLRNMSACGSHPVQEQLGCQTCSCSTKQHERDTPGSFPWTLWLRSG